MGEVAFARQFLAILDTKPVKYSDDHVFDPRKLPAQPAYTLPRMPQPYEKPGGTTSPPQAGGSAAGTITVKLKPLSSTAEPITLNDISPAASIYDVKAQVAKQAGYAIDKVKILWERRPVSDTKTVQEIAGQVAAGQSVDMGVMFVGKPTQAPSTGGTAAQATSPPGSETAPVQEKQTGQDALESQEFWDDLKGFVVQRLRDQKVGEEVVSVFREAWKAKSSRSR